MEDATDRKLTLNKSSPNEKASEDDMNQMGAAGENESKQQTEGAGRESNKHTITFLNYLMKRSWNRVKRKQLNRIELRMPGAPKPSKN